MQSYSNPQVSCGVKSNDKLASLWEETQQYLKVLPSLIDFLNKKNYNTLTFRSLITIKLRKKTDWEETPFNITTIINKENHW